MNLLRLFGFGSDKVLAKGFHVPGKVTKTYSCWWLKVNTKPVRLHSLDGARFPHIITFAYTVDSIPYEGKLWVPYSLRPPQPGEEIPVYYDPDKPEHYACYAFGPRLP